MLSPVYISHLPGEPGDELTDWVSYPVELVAVRLPNAGKLCEGKSSKDARFHLSPLIARMPTLPPLQMSSQTVITATTSSKRRLRLKVQISGYDHRRT